MKKNPLFLLLLLAGNGFAQLPETDIFISRIKSKDGKLEFTSPENISHRKGYDNQPYFLPDGSGMLYTAVEDTSQADIFRYQFSEGKSKPITRTPESEYSPMLMPDGKSFSVVRVDSDNGQRLYSYPFGRPGEAMQIKGSDSIGYYCWLTDSTVAMFILGDAMTLQILNRKTRERTLVASDIGRCLKLSHDKKNLYFIIKQNELEWGIFQLNLASAEKKKVCSTLNGSEDFAVMKDGSLLMGSEGKLFRFRPERNDGWEEVADFSGALGDFYRIVLNPAGDIIALVAFTGKKP